MSTSRIIFVGGKGGVGKTTIATSLALRLSKVNTTLLISTDPAHSLKDVLHTDRGANITNLEIWELDAEDEYQKFIQQHEDELRIILDTSTYLDHSDIDHLLSIMLPGIDEIMAFKTITDLVEQGQYSTFVVDTAPTGHTLRLLFMPDVLDQWIKYIASLRQKYRIIQQTFTGKYQPDKGDDLLLTLKKSVLRMRKLLKENKTVEFVIVSNPEPVVVAETVMIKEKLDQYGIRVCKLFINRVREPHSACTFCLEEFKAQKPYLEKLQQLFSEQQIIEIQKQAVSVTGVVALQKLLPYNIKI